MTREAVEGAGSDYAKASSFMIGMGVLALIFGGLIAFFLTRGITRPINRVVAGLKEGAEQVASASSQVAASSQHLAEGRPSRRRRWRRPHRRWRRCRR